MFNGLFLRNEPQFLVTSFKDRMTVRPVVQRGSDFEAIADEKTSLALPTPAVQQLTLWYDIDMDTTCRFLNDDVFGTTSSCMLALPTGLTATIAAAIPDAIASPTWLTNMACIARLHCSISCLTRGGRPRKVAFHSHTTCACTCKVSYIDFVSTTTPACCHSTRLIVDEAFVDTHVLWKYELHYVSSLFFLEVDQALTRVFHEECKRSFHNYLWCYVLH